MPSSPNLRPLGNTGASDAALGAAARVAAEAAAETTSGWFRDPFRYPQWLEATFAITWLSWSVANLLSPDALTERPGLAILNALGGWLWPWVGFLLFPWQIGALRAGSLRQRALVQTAGYVILFHVTLSVGAMSLDPFSPIITLLLALTTIAGILSWRLWRRYA
ncbi:hypothetical protein [Roseomonas indoligenes]|uniref:Uncharacterized protein n=1 Tax=Roseomonas indoligenes TaxID=2820811 RepID=A0A940MX38_9PROT|nr:hypothetical protein [Pararoseomonas indoligenes]MBP0492091.1 hypothetical protein [Pararoseomonas indoligenes]MBP0493031.1 hypothetical protein [Pararoseomonas indoligenes]